MTGGQALSVEKLHDVESILHRLRMASSVNLGAIGEYLSCIRQALQQNESLRLAILDRKRRFGPGLSAWNRRMTDRIQAEVNEHLADTELSFQIRQDLGTLWKAFLALEYRREPD